MIKITYKDPFMGEIELTQVGETSKHIMGESRIDTIYKDSHGNYYIKTWTTLGDMDPLPISFLRKEVAKIISQVENAKNTPTVDPQKIIPPLTRLIKEGTCGDCPSCGSTQLKKMISRKVLGCINPECKNYHKNK